jgi:hypothetical protein
MKNRWKIYLALPGVRVGLEILREAGAAAADTDRRTARSPAARTSPRAARGVLQELHLLHELQREGVAEGLDGLLGAGVQHHQLLGCGAVEDVVHVRR